MESEQKRSFSHVNDENKDHEESKELKATMVLSICASSYYILHSLPGVEKNKKVIWHMHQKIQNAPVYYNVNNIVTKELMEYMLNVFTKDCLKNKEGLDGVHVFVSGHGTETTFWTSDGYEISFKQICNRIAASIPNTIPFFFYDVCFKDCIAVIGCALSDLDD
eukprot:97833_1